MIRVSKLKQYLPRKKYVSLMIAAMQRSIAYRRTVAINILSRIIWLCISYYLWQAVFLNQEAVNDFSWREMRTYIVVSYAINVLLYSSSAYRLMAIIRTGDIAQELLRPIDFMRAQMAQAVGSAMIEGSLGVIIAVAIGIILRILPPSSPMNTLLFLCSVILGFLVTFLIHFLVALLCFWTLNWLGLFWAETALVNTFSGALLPLTFFPPWLQTIAYLLPFHSIVATPTALYLGNLQGIEAWISLAVQIVWALILWRVARFLWFPSLRALEIQRG